MALINWVTGSQTVPGKKKEKKKKKRQPSFTIPRNPYKYNYGSYQKSGATATWTGFRRGNGKNGAPEWTVLNSLNAKISQSLDFAEINAWLKEQKVCIYCSYCLWGFG